MKLTICAGAALVFAATLSGQNPLTTETKALHDGVKNNLIRAAEKMPEENYGFQATPDVRSFGQLVGHVADAQYLFCAPVKDEKKGPPGIEKTKTSKAELVAALKEAFEYCDGAYAAMDDAKITATVKFFRARTAEADRSQFQHIAQQRALREYRYVYAAEGTGTAVERAALNEPRASPLTSSKRERVATSIPVLVRFANIAAGSQF
jgi:hypothetical protein